MPCITECSDSHLTEVPISKITDRLQCLQDGRVVPKALDESDCGQSDDPRRVPHLYETTREQLLRELGRRRRKAAREGALAARNRSEIDAIVSRATKLLRSLSKEKLVTVVFDELERAEAAKWKVKDVPKRLEAWIRSCKRVPRDMKFSMKPGNLL